MVRWQRLLVFRSKVGAFFVVDQKRTKCKFVLKNRFFFQITFRFRVFSPRITTSSRWTLDGIWGSVLGRSELQKNSRKTNLNRLTEYFKQQLSRFPQNVVSKMIFSNFGDKFLEFCNFIKIMRKFWKNARRYIFCRNNCQDLRGKFWENSTPFGEIFGLPRKNFDSILRIWENPKILLENCKKTREIWKICGKGSERFWKYNVEFSGKFWRNWSKF